MSLRFDAEVLEWWRGPVQERGGGHYQTMLNAALATGALAWITPTKLPSTAPTRHGTATRRRAGVDAALDRIDAGLAAMDARLTRLEASLDRLAATLDRMILTTTRLFVWWTVILSLDIALSFGLMAWRR